MTIALADVTVLHLPFQFLGPFAATIQNYVLILSCERLQDVPHATHQATSYDLQKVQQHGYPKNTPIMNTEFSLMMLIGC